MTDPLQSLEERVAHLMRTVDELSDVIARQDAEINRLSRKVQLLLDREAQQPGSVVLGNERPPHY